MCSARRFLHSVSSKESSTAYQPRKKVFTTNSIFLDDNLGQIFTFESPNRGNHHDLNGIETILKEILQLLEEAKTEHKGLFLNADAGFDSKKFRKILREKEIIENIPKNPRNGESSIDNFLIFDEELYKNRFKIERSLVWLNGFKGLIIRYETLNTTWNTMLYLELIGVFIKKFKRVYCVRYCYYIHNSHFFCKNIKITL